MIVKNIKHLGKGIFLIDFYRHSDMCWTFLRAQEYYECVNPKFNREMFKVVDFIKWHIDEFGNGEEFLYVANTGGFNISGAVINEVYFSDNSNRCDYNEYDLAMISLYNYCSELYGDKFYLIAGCDNQSINHEIAHGLYSIEKDYRDTMKKLVSSLPLSTIKCFDKYLKDEGYSASTYEDETHAYIATGLTNSLTNRLKNDKILHSVEYKKISKLIQDYFSDELIALEANNE